MVYGVGSTARQPTLRGGEGEGEFSNEVEAASARKGFRHGVSGSGFRAYDLGLTA